MKSFKWQVLQWLLAFSGSLLLALLLPPPCGAVRDCQRIEIKHGAVHRKHKGRVLEFKCDPGFWLQGTERIFCTSDGVVKRGYNIPLELTISFDVVLLLPLWREISSVFCLDYVQKREKA